MSLSLENQHPVIICTYTDNGYDRQTTPWMDKMAGCKGTTIFSYPYANYCQTILSLTYALSEKNQYNHIPLEEAYSIIDLAKAAGYDTYWISDQAGFSASDTPITIISSPQHIILGSMEEAHPPVIPHTLMENLLQNFQIT